MTRTAVKLAALSVALLVTGCTHDAAEQSSQPTSATGRDAPRR